MALTPIEEADLLIMRQAYLNGLSVPELPAATDLNGLEEFEVSQEGVSKKAPLNLINSIVNIQYADAFGFLPTATATENTAALNAAIFGGSKTIVVRIPGIYNINGTIYLDDDTELIFYKGVVLSRTGTTFSFINRGALTRTWNYNIKITGLNIECNNTSPIDGVDYNIPHYGLRGVVSFFYVDGLIIDDIRINEALDVGIQICTWHNVSISNFYVKTDGDGIHINKGNMLRVTHGSIWSTDDAIPLNACDWLNSAPEVGDIFDVIIDDVTDLKKPTTGGNFSRNYIGAWVDWFYGMEVQIGDVAVNDGRTYRVVAPIVFPNPVLYNSATAPTGTGYITDAGGFHWRYEQPETTKTANIYNVVYSNLRLLEDRRAIGVGATFSDPYSRTVYPTASPLPRATGIKILNVDKLSNGILLGGGVVPGIIVGYFIQNITNIIDGLWSYNYDAYGYVIIENCNLDRYSGEIISPTHVQLTLNNMNKSSEAPIMDITHSGSVNSNCLLDSLPMSPLNGDSVRYQGFIWYYKDAWVKII